MIEFERKKIDTNLNIAPLIDCVFILLIFFLLTSSFIEEMGFKINLPEATAPLVLKEEKISIFIDGNERIYMNGKEVTIQDLRRILKDTILQAPQRLIDIRSDGNVRLKVITEVMDIASASGAKRLSIATIYKEKDDK